MTIKDIARIAGVTHSTVSRSLNDSPMVSEATRERIKAIAREHGYSPNTFARRLVTRRSRTFGLFFLSRVELDFMENFGTQFLSKITGAAYAAGYDLLLFTTPKDTANSRSYLRLCKERHVEGAIIIGLTSDDPHLEELRRAPFPVSVIDYRLEGPNVGFVGTDSAAGIRTALDWLAERGHRRVAFIGGPLESPVAMEREAIYREIQEGRGLFDPSDIHRGNYSSASGYHRALDILRRPSVPTAVLAANDFMAMGAIKAFKENGLRVPVDISVMGYDNAAVAEYADPALTTIGQDTEAIGSQAVRFIIDRLEGRDCDPVMAVPPLLIVRESVRRIPRD